MEKTLEIFFLMIAAAAIFAVGLLSLYGLLEVFEIGKLLGRALATFTGQKRGCITCRDKDTASIEHPCDKCSRSPYFSKWHRIPKTKPEVKK